MNTDNSERKLKEPKKTKDKKMRTVNKMCQTSHLIVIQLKSKKKEKEEGNVFRGFDRKFF